MSQCMTSEGIWLAGTLRGVYHSDNIMLESSVRRDLYKYYSNAVGMIIITLLYSGLFFVNHVSGRRY